MRRLNIVAMTWLTACAGAASDVRPPVCDWLVLYPPAVQAEAADELQRCEVPVLRRLVEDYGELRARIRATCR